MRSYLVTMQMVCVCVCVCVCIYIYTHIHICVCVCIYIYIYIYILWMKNARLNLPQVNLHHGTRKRRHINIRLLKRSCRAAAFWRIKKLLQVSTKCPPWASTQAAARLNSDCLTRCKTADVVRIASDPFRIHATSLLSVAQTADVRCPQR